MLEPSAQLHDKILEAMTAPGQQFEVTEAEIRGNTYKVFKNAPASVAQYLGLAMTHKDKDFLVYEGERYTYGDTYLRAHALAYYLREEYGIGKGDKVVIAMRNYPEWVFAFMATMLLGAVAVPLNAWWLPEELVYALGDSDAKLAIVDAARAERFSTIPHDERPPCLIARAEFDVPHGMARLEDSILTSGKMVEPLDIDTDEDATILYTSGSTGNPKGAVGTQRALVTALMNFAAYGLAFLEADKTENEEPEHQQAVLLAVPLFHVTGLVPVCLMSFLMGRKMVIMHKWDVTDAFRLIEEEKVTQFVGVPTMSLEMMQHPDREKYDVSTLRDLSAGGAARPAEHVRRLKDTFPEKHPTAGYGLTETMAAGAVNSREGYMNRPASTGRATTPMMELCVMDDDGNHLGPEEIGEVCIRSAAVVRGYHNKPKSTAEAFMPDGWFRTGDLGKFDEDGYIYIVDRKKDIIIRGGENISCLEVEAALYHHEAVAEASVFGLPDERLGEIVGAVVFPKSNAQVDPENLQDYVAKHLAAFKVPAQIWVSNDPLPKLGTGKIDKPALRKVFAS